MSDLSIRPSAFAPPPASAAAAPAETRSDAWLREFERARWEAQPHYQRDAGADAAQALEDEAGGETRSAPSHNGGIDSPSDPHTGSTRAARDDGMGDALSPRSQATVSSHAHAPIGTPMGIAAMVPNEPPAQVGTASEPAPRARTPLDATPWQSRSVHVHVGAQCTAVWIRDARLSPQDAVRLLEQLRPLAGRALDPDAAVRLTVNGHVVDRPHNH